MKRNYLSFLLGISILALSLNFTGCKKVSEIEMNAIQSVSPHLYTHSLSVAEKDLQTEMNPNGEGIFVYTKKKDTRGIEQRALWFVFNDKVFPLNHKAKEVTPALKWPSEVMPDDWRLTGLNLYSFHKPIQWIFG